MLEVFATYHAYRYGFQGQEKDDEIKGEGNSLNYTYRMHDPRLGRFFAVDPLTARYPHYTPYIFAGNKVIRFIELEGGETSDPAIWQLTVHLAKEVYQQLLTEYETLKADAERLQTMATEAWRVAERYGQAAQLNPENTKLQQAAVQATNNAMIADKNAKDAVNRKGLAASNLIKFVEETDIEPTTTFRAKIAGLGGGEGYGAVSYSKMHIYTRSSTGVYENGLTLVSSGTSGGPGVGIGGSAGGGKGEIVLNHPSVSLTTTMNSVNMVNSLEWGGSVGGGYHRQDDWGYSVSTTYEGELSFKEIYTGGFNKLVGGIDVGISYSSTITSTAWVTNGTIDSLGSELDNVVFKDFDKALQKRGYLDADSLLKYTKKDN